MNLPAEKTTRRKGPLWHLLAYFVAALCVGIFFLAVPASLEIINNPFTPGKSGLAGFVFSMGIFMGMFHVIYGSLFYLAGLLVGYGLKMKQWWFCALWGGMSAPLTAAAFSDPSQKLDLRFYATLAFAGFAAGTIYWLIAVRNPS